VGVSPGVTRVAIARPSAGQCDFGGEGLVIEAERSRRQELLWLREAAKCTGNIRVVQVQPRKAGEGLGALVLQVFAGSFGIFSVVGVKGRNDVGVIRRTRDVRFFSIKSQKG
jgi:hypothetical protein